MLKNQGSRRITVALSELNLKENLEKKKEINIVKKDKTREKIKTLSSKEIREIKKNIKKIPFLLFSL